MLAACCRFCFRYFWVRPREKYPRKYRKRYCMVTSNSERSGGPPGMTICQAAPKAASAAGKRLQVQRTVAGEQQRVLEASWGH
ncbi:hypothetical protein VTN96DRAFT_6817 [Rasamsonia emersonii]